MLVSRRHCLHSIDHPGQKGSILAKLQLFAFDTDIELVKYSAYLCHGGRKGSPKDRWSLDGRSAGDKGGCSE